RSASARPAAPERRRRGPGRARARRSQAPPAPPRSPPPPREVSSSASGAPGARPGGLAAWPGTRPRSPRAPARRAGGAGPRDRGRRSSLEPSLLELGAQPAERADVPHLGGGLAQAQIACELGERLAVQQAADEHLSRSARQRIDGLAQHLAE